MKLLFVDHSFHARTRSAAFFVELLRRFLDVEVLYVDPRKAPPAALTRVAGRYDAALFWQLDYLAPIAIAQGVPTIVAPMFDGSSQMPDLHWLWSRQARFISFSRRLHAHIGRLGLSSMPVRYYKAPRPWEQTARFGDGLRVLLWQRRPEEHINLRTIETLFGPQLTSVHIHDAPDNPRLDTSAYLTPSLRNYHFTTSRWFADGAGFGALMADHNVLVAPRRAEGIGMVMLEAMARGMVVAAADAPTHDEYICNWVNGILFNPVDVGPANVGDPAALGAMAWRSVKDGYERWRAAEPQIIDWIRSTPSPAPNPSVDLESLQAALSAAHRRGGRAYNRWLLSQLPLVEDMGRQSLAGSITAAGAFDHDRHAREREATSPQWLAQNRLHARDLLAGRHLVRGELRERNGLAWMGSEGLEMSLAIDPSFGAARRLRMKLHGRAGEPPDCRVLLNGHRLVLKAADAGWVEAAPPTGGLAVDNRLRIAPASGKANSLAFEALEFV